MITETWAGYLASLADEKYRESIYPYCKRRHINALLESGIVTEVFFQDNHWDTLHLRVDPKKAASNWAFVLEEITRCGADEVSVENGIIRLWWD